MNIDEKYERELVKKQEEIYSRIEALYRKFITEVAPLLSNKSARVALRRAINASIRELNRSVRKEIVSGIISSWDLSNLKHNAYLDKRLKPYSDRIPDDLKKVWYDPNLAARNEFLKRKRNGLNLSDRVWKHTRTANKNITSVLGKGISTGTSSIKIAKQLRSDLLDPISSPVSKTKRLARTETNMAYRSADQEAWAKDPAILGYEINLSKTQSKKVKARCEICRALAGKYPVTFVFVGWHPNCLCYKTPIEMSPEQFAKYMKLIAQGKDTKSAVEAIRKEAGIISDVPDGFKTWVADNQKRVGGWKSQPYWVKDNFKYGKIGKGLKTVVGSANVEVKTVPDYTPKGLDNYEKKLGVKIDRGIFKYLNKETPLKHLQGGAHFRTDQNYVSIPFDDRRRKSKWVAESVVYHEFGHAADWQNDFKNRPEVKALMNKYREKLGDSFGEIIKQTDAIGYDAYSRGDFDTSNQAGALDDTIMSLDKRFGKGHDYKVPFNGKRIDYFDVPGFSEAEFLAHAFENKFVGNKVFERISPDLYRDMIELIEKLMR